MKTATASQLLKVDTELTTEQIQKFFTSTPSDKIKERPAKGGGTWKYVDGGYVTQVLNSLFGFNWSFEVVTTMQEALSTAATGTVVVQGRLKVKIGDDWITKEQYGRKEVTYRKGTKDLLDFGNDMKAAATDAKKKCASELGLFADVYSEDNLLEAKIIDDTADNILTDEEVSRQINEATTSDQLKALLTKLTPYQKRYAQPLIAQRLQEVSNGNSSTSGAAKS